MNPEMSGMGSGAAVRLMLAPLDPGQGALNPVSYTHLRAHETPEHIVCRLLLEKKN